VRNSVISLDVFNDPNRVLPERGQPVSLGFSHDNLLVLDEDAV
jgi:putative spermidine/putrescine transport system ATP-binding protein